MSPDPEPTAPPVAIHAEGLGKSFRIGTLIDKNRTFGEAVTDLAKRPFRSFRDRAGLAGDEFWALTDISFDIHESEVVGLIGRNGAGKSTLLKTLARISEPSAGFAEIHGRVGSLLEVGTGFHPELTGRENIYLNGSVLGMSREEISRKFDDIVDFSGVAKFIETPVKRYSSGMQMRLAFAVAANIEPEILLIDEVLSVGDSEFQKKCLGKMDEVAGHGRTVVFVSHNMGAIQNLCSRTIMLEHGRMVADGPTHQVIAQYLGSAKESSWTNPDPDPPGPVIVQTIGLTQNGEEAPPYLDPSQPTEITVRYEVTQPIEHLLLGFDIRSNDGTQVCRTYDWESAAGPQRQPGHYTARLVMHAGLFRPQTYYLELVTGIHRQKWLSKDEVTVTMEFESEARDDVSYAGALQTVGSWTVNAAVPERRGV